MVSTQGYSTFGRVREGKVHHLLENCHFFCSAGLLWGRPRLWTWPFSESCASSAASMGRGEDACKCVVCHVSSECAICMVEVLCWWCICCVDDGSVVCTEPTVCEYVVFGELGLSSKWAQSVQNSQCPCNNLINLVQNIIWSDYYVGLLLALVLDSCSISSIQGNAVSVQVFVQVIFEIHDFLINCIIYMHSAGVIMYPWTTCSFVQSCAFFLVASWTIPAERWNSSEVCYSKEVENVICIYLVSVGYVPTRKILIVLSCLSFTAGLGSTNTFLSPLRVLILFSVLFA